MKKLRTTILQMKKLRTTSLQMKERMALARRLMTQKKSSSKGRGIS